MHMLTLRKQPQYIQKTIVLPNGSRALVVFELVEVGGKITAKAVFGKMLEQAKETVLSLPVFVEKQNIRPVASPFFSFVSEIAKDLSFIISQPSRAPNFA